jgi:hypothetical protein
MGGRRHKFGRSQPDEIAGKPFPVVVDRARFQAELDALRVREKAHTQQRDGLVALFFWIGILAFCRLASGGSAKHLGFVFRAITGSYQGFGNRYQGVQRDSSPDHS